MQFYGACIDNDQLYMVTEFMEHGDLFTALNNPERGPHYSWYKKCAPSLCLLCSCLHLALNRGRSTAEAQARCGGEAAYHALPV